MSNENKSLTPDIKSMLDEAYNEGVEDAILFIRGHLSELRDGSSLKTHYGALIVALNQLKKQ